MASVARDEVVGCLNPKFDLFTSVDGKSTDVYQVEFIVTDAVDVQIYPGAGRQAIDVDTDCPTGERLGVGHYVAPWTVPSGQALGTYKLKWFFQLTASSPEQTFVEEFEVVSVVGSGVDGYALVQDFRDEGFTVAMVSDSRLLALIQMQSQYIDMLTGQWFNPRTGTLTIDGRGSRALRLPVPIISITEVRLDGSVVDAAAYRVYSRHLTAGVTAEDDRNDPRIVFYESTSELPLALWAYPAWPPGFQNLEVDGVFGYTDGPGPVGTTPLLIKEALMLLVRKKIPLMSAVDERTAELVVGKVMREETRDQRVELNPKLMERGGSFGYTLTGDSEIDSILIHFMGPISIGHTGGDASPGLVL